MAGSIISGSLELPDLVLEKIFRLIPTKAAVQVGFLSEQWRTVILSHGLELNLDEDDDFGRHNLKLYDHRHRHRKFTNFLEGYLDYCQKDDCRRELLKLDKLRLRMRMYVHRRDSSIISKWLRYALAIERGVKEVEISPGNPKQYRPNSTGRRDRPMYCLPWKAFLYADSLTSLTVECVIVPFILVYKYKYTNGVYQHLFPSLKTLSFTTARFYHQTIDNVIFNCPSLESLTLIHCSIGHSMCYVKCSSLKTLSIKYCSLEDIQVDEAKNLECFTFVSPHQKCRQVILNSTINLKSINICVDELRELSILGCDRALEATINAQKLYLFDFFDGYLDAKVYFDACEKARISVMELLDDEEERKSSYSTQVPMLLSVLKRYYSSCKKIYLYNQHVRALMVPKNYRKMTSFSPLPYTEVLEVRMQNPPTEGSKDYMDLVDSCHWIAPSALISIWQVDFEVDREQVNKRARPHHY